jgi:hypothetical protein
VIVRTICRMATQHDDLIRVLNASIPRAALVASVQALPDASSTASRLAWRAARHPIALPDTNTDGASRSTPARAVSLDKAAQLLCPSRATSRWRSFSEINPQQNEK